MFLFGLIDPKNILNPGIPLWSTAWTRV